MRFAQSIAVAVALLSAPFAHAANGLQGTYILEADSDGATPKAKAAITLTFKGADHGTVTLLAKQPGETVTDTATFSTRGSLITIAFKEMGWTASEQPFTLDACRLTLPFKALGSTEGAGTSTWRRVDAACDKKDLPLPSFSADEILIESGVQVRSRVYATATAMRIESPDGTAIVRFDRGILYRFAPGASRATEERVPFRGPLVLTRGSAPAPGCRTAGVETIAGHACEKQECRVVVGETTLVETYWIANDMGGLLLKYTDGETTVAFEDVRLGPQDPKLFGISNLE